MLVHARTNAFARLKLDILLRGRGRVMEKKVEI